MKKILACILITVLFLTGCSAHVEQKPEGIQINLSDEKITVDGSKIANDNTQAVYSANDIVFYLAGQDFTYGEGTKEDEHQQSEADAHTVVHITKPGKYVLSGKLSAGQIAVDLGDDAEKNPEAVVTLILNGVDITCTVAPAIIFYNVYECSVADEKTATKDVDTKNAGANIIVADNSENNINGSYVAKIYKSYELNEDGTEVVDSKKLHKYDAAVYSKKTMNVDGGENGSDTLNIKAENEGLDTELHLTINGGNINITSGNDGINTNEDNVSVTTINGGSLNILCDGKTGEGDGIDSNGWLVINGGTVISQACATSGDAGIDSDLGIYINGGNVIASGNMLDKISGGEQTYAVFSFTTRQVGDSTYILKNAENEKIGEYSPTNDFTYLLVAGDKLVEGDYTFWQGDSQLCTYSNISTQNENPMDNMQQPPENINGEQPKKPEDMENPPENFGEMGNPPENLGEMGNPPEVPNGMEIPDGEIPQMPNGERPERPNGMGGMGGIGMMNGEASTIFTIIKGGNQFFNVSPVPTTITE